MSSLRTLLSIFIITASLLTSAQPASARSNAAEMTQKTAENQIRHLLEPILDRYCHDACRLMSVSATVDLATTNDIAPGFDDPEIRNADDLAPSSGRVKILIDDKVGPISRTKLLELLQQYMETLEYPVKIETQTAHFPLPQGSEGKVTELRDRISKQFLDTTSQLLNQFCPDHCILADFNLQTSPVNGEEAQYGATGEFVQDGDTTIRIKSISATIMMDKALTPDEQNNILEMLKLKTTEFKNVSLTSKVLNFPRVANAVNRTTGKRAIASVDETEQQKNSTDKQEKVERVERIERVENGDAVQAELQKFKLFGLIFACSILALLIFIAISNFRPIESSPRFQRVLHSVEAVATPGPEKNTDSQSPESLIKGNTLSMNYEIERLTEELTSIYAEQPRVAKQVFTRILTEEGVETTAECIHIFGEGIVVSMLRDPSLQSDLNELMEYYAKNQVQIKDLEKLELLRKLHNRTIAGKLVVLGSRSSNQFDFLSEMDGLQILELIRTESLTVKSIALTQCDPQKRSVVYAQMEPELRMQLLAELSRIDYLPKDYISNVAIALKRKKKENPKLNTEALPGSEVLVSLLERTGQEMQKSVIRSLESNNPDSARTVKSKLVSIDTLRFLRDGQLLEVILSLRHDELIQFLKGVSPEIRSTIYSKSPKDLVVELEEEISQLGPISREAYQGIERRILNRMKIMANEGQINLVETNDRMFMDELRDTAFIQAGSGGGKTPPPARKAAR